MDFSLQGAGEFIQRPAILLVIAILVSLAVAYAARCLLFAILRTIFPHRPQSRLAILLDRMRFAAFAWLFILLLGMAAPFIQTEGLSDFYRRMITILVIGALGATLLGLMHAWGDIATRRFKLDIDDNLQARKTLTRLRILKRMGATFIGVLTVGAMLMAITGVRDYGVSLFASAGAAGIVIGLAARSVLSNLLAGLQIALTQPIRIDDVVIVEGEWGRIEEITATYVVVHIWDWRRLIVPLSYFIEQPFQNWTRETAAIIGTVFWEVDYTVPVERVREKLTEFLNHHPLWDRDVVNLQVTDSKERTMTLRALMSARTSGDAWDLRCDIREKMIAWLQQDYPDALPRIRAEIGNGGRNAPAAGDAPTAGGAPSP